MKQEMLINVRSPKNAASRSWRTASWKSCTSSEPARTTTWATSTRVWWSTWSRASRRRSSILASAATASCTSATSSRSISAKAATIPDKPLGPPAASRRARRSSESAVRDEFDDGRTTGGRPQRTYRPGSRPRVQAAHPGNPPPRRRSAGAGHQGRHRHQGAHALDLHQHPRPLPGADAGPGPHRRLAEDRGRSGSPPPARHHARAEPAQGRGFHRPHRRQRPYAARALPRPGLPAAAVEGHRAAGQEVPLPRGHLRRKRHDHPHHPRHLYRGRGRHLHRRAIGLRAGPRVPATGHAPLR